MASYKIRTAGNCPAVFFYYHVPIHNRGDAYSILESDAKGRCRYGCCRRAILRSFNDCCRRNYSSLQLRKLESDADHLSRNDRCRRNHSSLPLRKLESDAGHRSRDGRCRRAIPHCCDDGAAVIRKSGPEIKNRCSARAVFGKSLQRLPN